MVDEEQGQDNKQEKKPGDGTNKQPERRKSMLMMSKNDNND